MLQQRMGDKTRVREILERHFGPDRGFECHPFKIGWYNEQVSEKFALPYQDPDTLAFVVISTPKMFENTFIPFLRRVYETLDEGEIPLSDPLDQCMRLEFQDAISKIRPIKVDALHDFEIRHNRIPKVLVQTAGHVSGAVRFYQQKDISSLGSERKKIFPVCLHPRYGGWFGLRGVLIFPELSVPELVRKSPPEILDSPETIARLLTMYNECWEDWEYRDIIPVEEKYSDLQKEYFQTKPSERFNVIRKCLS